MRRAQTERLRKQIKICHNKLVRVEQKNLIGRLQVGYVF